MKIKLLNDAGYGDMQAVKFPVEVEAKQKRGYFSVHKSELYRVGAVPGEFDILDDWAFAYDKVEVLP